MAEVATALASRHPFHLLAHASMLMAVVDPRDRNPFEKPDERRPRLERDELVASFLAIDQRETTALLYAFAAFTTDELEAARIRRELAARDHLLPVWLTRLDEVTAERAVEMVHVLGDGDNVMLDLAFPTGEHLTAVAYIDHNLGTVMKDGFFVPESLDAVLKVMRKASGDDPDTRFDEVAPADARVRITDAIESGARTVPPFETETWPACRPLMEWAASLLPEGGRGYERPEWDDDARAGLKGRFLASPFAGGLDSDQRDLFDDVLWFATGYGPGDPLRWSAVAVELLLLDWIPRKIGADIRYLSKAPDLLRAYIRFCHTERGIRPTLTAEVLGAVDRFEPEYQRAIRSPRLMGPQALLAAAGVLGPDAVPFVPDYRQLMLEYLERDAGGVAALDALDGSLLPDEDFDWTGIPDDVRDAVNEVVGFCDGCCDALLDTEYRTACRRFIASVASGDADVFRRRARADTAAAAVCWVVGKANDLFSPSGAGMYVKDLMAHFGIQQGSVSQRAKTFLRAGGFPADTYDVVLGSPRYLVSSRRRKMIEQRDRYRALLAADDGEEGDG